MQAESWALAAACEAGEGVASYAEVTVAVAVAADASQGAVIDQRNHPPHLVGRQHHPFPKVDSGWWHANRGSRVPDHS